MKKGTPGRRAFYFLHYRKPYFTIALPCSTLFLVITRIR